MIGFYDYTVILTYCGLFSSLMGIVLALNGNFSMAVLCMGISLFCDTFDGKVARGKKNRTERESAFGVQIDSLCDVISFGVFPAVFCYMLGASHKLDLLLIVGYCLCCVIRLGYFNVLAMDANEEKGIYHGLPVVCMSILMPLVYFVHGMIPDMLGLWLIRATLIVFSFLYIYDFKVKKPGIAALAIMCLIFWAPTAAIFIF